MDELALYMAHDDDPNIESIDIVQPLQADADEGSGCVPNEEETSDTEAEIRIEYDADQT